MMSDFWIFNIFFVMFVVLCGVLQLLLFNNSEPLEDLREMLMNIIVPYESLKKFEKVGYMPHIEICMMKF